MRHFVFGLAGAAIYGFCKSREQKFVMSFTMKVFDFHSMDGHAAVPTAG